MPVFEHTSTLPFSAQRVRAFHEAPDAFLRLLPPWDTSAVIGSPPRVALGDVAEVAVSFAPAALVDDDIGSSVFWRALSPTMRARIVEVTEWGFVDEQVSGPFSRYRHTHSYTPHPTQKDACLLVDRVDYALPQPLALLGGHHATKRLERLFRYRHRTTHNDLAVGEMLRGLSPAPMRVAVTGASGLLGRALCTQLRVLGHTVVPLVRDAVDGVVWLRDGRVVLDANDARLQGLDAVVHLAGESLAAHRLTAEQRAVVTDSRVRLTDELVQAFARVPVPPRAFLSASAVGFYGDRGDTVLDETSTVGQGFLPELVEQWELSARRAAQHGMRDVQLRFGVVLSPRGGALKKQLPLFAAGLGGVLGDGRFYQPTITIDDATAAIVRAIADARLTGPVNVTAPEAITNRTFTETLARVLHRPALLSVPSVALRAAMGPLADEGLMHSARVVPQALQQVGHAFLFPTLAEGLAHVLGR